MLFGDPKRVPNTNWESSSHRTRLYTHNVCQIGYYSELSCVGEVAQMQSIQQTGFLGIRPGVKKSPFVLLLDCAVFSLSDFCWVTHVEKPVALCLKAQMAKMIFFINLHSFQFLIVIWGAKRSWGGNALPPSPQLPQWQSVRPTSIGDSTSHLCCLSWCSPSSSSRPRLEQIINPFALIVWVLRDWSQQEPRTVLQGFNKALQWVAGAVVVSWG